MAAPVIAPKGSTALIRPSLGLYFDRPALQIPDQGMKSCLNVRIKEGEVRNENMGWGTFPPGNDIPINLDNADVLLIDQLILRGGLRFLILANQYDLFLYDDNLETISYITPLLDIAATTVSGFIFDNPNTRVAGVGTTWDTAVPARNGLTEIIVGDWIHFGAANEQSQTATWYQVTAVNSDIEIEVAGDASGEATGAYTVRQTFTGDVGNCWYSDTFPAADTGSGFEDQWLATNSVDSVVKYAGPGADPNGAEYLDLGFTCRTLLYDNNIMLYANLIEAGESKPQAIRNSDVGFPEVVDGTGFSSEFTVTNGTDAILRAQQLGDVVVVYSGRSISTMQFVGDPFIYVVRTAISDRGIFAEGSLADFGNFHEFLSSDTIYRFDGVGINEYASHVFREILRTISPNRVNRAVTHIDEENGEVQWVLPLTTDNTGEDGASTRSYTEHYLEEVGGKPTPFTFRDLPATAAGFHDRQTSLTWADILVEWQNANFRWNDRFFEAAFPFSLFGDSDGFVYILNSRDHQIDGAVPLVPIAIDSRWRTPLRAMIDGSHVGMLQRVEPYATTRPGAAYSLGVSVFGTDRAQGELTSIGFAGYLLNGTGERFVPIRGAARYVEIEFGTNGIDHPYEMGGYGTNVRQMGSR